MGTSVRYKIPDIVSNSCPSLHSDLPMRWSGMDRPCLRNMGQLGGGQSAARWVWCTGVCFLKGLTARRPALQHCGTGPALDNRPCQSAPRRETPCRCLQRAVLDFRLNSNCRHGLVTLPTNSRVAAVGQKDWEGSLVKQDGVLLQAYGARPLRRAVANILEDALADVMLRGTLQVCIPHRNPFRVSLKRDGRSAWRPGHVAASWTGPRCAAALCDPSQMRFPADYERSGSGCKPFAVDAACRTALSSPSATSCDQCHALAQPGDSVVAKLSSVAAAAATAMAAAGRPPLLGPEAVALSITRGGRDDSSGGWLSPQRVLSNVATAGGLPLRVRQLRDVNVGAS